jgi:hypothetical protein
MTGIGYWLGFRMPALTDRATRTGAGVRKPSGDETAGGAQGPASENLQGTKPRETRSTRAGRHRPGYGDFAAGSEVRVADSIDSAVDFAASASRELMRNGAARVLRDEVMWF